MPGRRFSTAAPTVPRRTTSTSTLDKAWAARGCALRPGRRRSSSASAACRAAPARHRRRRADVLVSRDIRWTWSAGAWHRARTGVPFSVTGTGSIAPGQRDPAVRHRSPTRAIRTSPVHRCPTRSSSAPGRAQLFRDGKVIEGTWSKAGRGPTVTTFNETTASRCCLASRTYLGRATPVPRDGDVTP